MANGQQKAQQNIAKITQWISERDSMKDYGEYERQGKINRQALCAELDFGRSVIAQNPTVKKLLSEAEARWFNTKEVDAKAHDAARERSEKRVAQSNADKSKLLDEVAKLKAENAALKLQLKKYAAMDEIIQQTGMFPR